MGTLNRAQMQAYLGRSISSFNDNKLNGVLAEIEFRAYLARLGYADQVSAGGWVTRSKVFGDSHFGAHTIALFPEHLVVGRDYGPSRKLPQPDHGLHTICSTLHQLGIHSFWCTPTVNDSARPDEMTWRGVQLGIPKQSPPVSLSAVGAGFGARTRRYNHLRYRSDLSKLPDLALAEEFSKESLRVAFSDLYMAETSDIDGLFWGQQYTYPIELKEKTAAYDKDVGAYFGLDVGPFVKLAYYAAKRGTLHSLFVVREIDSTVTRNLLDWWYITFDELAQNASWIPRTGGMGMSGGASSVVRIPRSAFRRLDASEIGKL